MKTFFGKTTDSFGKNFCLITPQLITPVGLWDYIDRLNAEFLKWTNSIIILYKDDRHRSLNDNQCFPIKLLIGASTVMIPNYLGLPNYNDTVGRIPAPVEISYETRVQQESKKNSISTGARRISEPSTVSRVNPK